MTKPHIWIERITKVPLPITKVSIRWQNIVGYPGPQTLKQLQSSTDGVLFNNRGPQKEEFDACTMLKLK